jgi:hypothetical protein
MAYRVNTQFKGGSSGRLLAKAVAPLRSPIWGVIFVSKQGWGL